MEEVRAAVHGLQRREAQEVDPLLAARQAKVATVGTRQPTSVQALASAEYRLDAPANGGSGRPAALQATSPKQHDPNKQLAERHHLQADVTYDLE